MELNDATVSRIPFRAVGYEGYGSIETLKGRLEGTTQADRPDAALVVDSGAYVEYLGSQLDDAGLFAFAAAGSHFVRNVLAAAPDSGA